MPHSHLISVQTHARWPESLRVTPAVCQDVNVWWLGVYERKDLLLRCAGLTTPRQAELRQGAAEVLGNGLQRVDLVELFVHQRRLAHVLRAVPVQCGDTLTVRTAPDGVGEQALASPIVTQDMCTDGQRGFHSSSQHDRMARQTKQLVQQNAGTDISRHSDGAQLGCCRRSHGWGEAVCRHQRAAHTL